MIHASFSSHVTAGGSGATGGAGGAVAQEALTAARIKAQTCDLYILGRMIACSIGAIGSALFMSFQYIAIEGPIGVGKTSLAERLAARFDAELVLEETDNPFLADFYAGRPGAALQAQLFYLLNRHRQQLELRQGDLFAQTTVADYLFDKDKIFAYLNLDDNELFIYQRLYDLLARDVPSPDLVIYLQAPSDVLLQRVRDRTREVDDTPLPQTSYIREVNEAYQHFFFHYSATPLLVVETSHVDLAASDGAVDDLLRQVRSMGKGTRYYVPRT